MEYRETQGYLRSESITLLGQEIELDSYVKTTQGVTVTKGNGSSESLDILQWYYDIKWASAGYENVIVPSKIIDETLKNIFNGIATKEVEDALVMACISLVEHDPAYGYTAAQLLLKKLFKQVTGQS